jgi:hypothetical protein
MIQVTTISPLGSTTDSIIKVSRDQIEFARYVSTENINVMPFLNQLENVIFSGRIAILNESKHSIEIDRLLYNTGRVALRSLLFTGMCLYDLSETETDLPRVRPIHDLGEYFYRDSQCTKKMGLFLLNEPTDAGSLGNCTWELRNRLYQARELEQLLLVGNARKCLPMMYVREVDQKDTHVLKQMNEPEEPVKKIKIDPFPSTQLSDLAKHTFRTELNANEDILPGPIPTVDMTAFKQLNDELCQTIKQLLGISPMTDRRDASFDEHLYSVNVQSKCILIKQVLEVMLNDYWKKDDTQIEVCPRIPYQIVQNLREKDYISQTYFAEYMYTSFGISVHAFATK